ncbi:hypothetical protein Tsubulata_023430 [Turnera subulata]|uniref:Uncharacterized protein n=1 Tax=Turnera subulata TaxID=218843 RepID=A0A9Q0F1Z2_9ROSI|nr:hypothetical protein Tsubulata_023430 [Turnera subulata]
MNFSSTSGKNIKPPEVYPATSSASTRCFSSGFNVHIYVEEDEPEEEWVVWRFRREEVMKAHILQECKSRRYFESSQDKKKRKAREATGRNREWCPQTRRNKKERTTRTTYRRI